jgi:hypothetical protein
VDKDKAMLREMRRRYPGRSPKPVEEQVQEPHVRCRSSRPSPMRLLGSIEIIRDCRLERENAEDDTIGYVVPASSPLILPTPLHIPNSSRRHRLLLQIEEEVFFRQDRGGSAASGGSAPSGGSETCTGRWSGVDGNNRSIIGLFSSFRPTRRCATRTMRSTGQPMKKFIIRPTPYV